MSLLPDDRASHGGKIDEILIAADQACSVGNVDQVKILIDRAFLYFDMRQASAPDNQL